MIRRDSKKIYEQYIVLKKKYKSILEISRILNIPYGTLYRIIQRKGTDRSGRNTFMISEEKRILRAIDLVLEKRYPYSMAAFICKVNETTLRCRMIKCGLITNKIYQKRVNKKLHIASKESAWKINKIIHLLYEGKKYSEIANELNINFNTAIRWLKKYHGIDRKEYLKINKINGFNLRKKGKLKDINIINKIKEYINVNDINIKDMAEKFGYSSQSIRKKIKNNLGYSFDKKLSKWTIKKFK